VRKRNYASPRPTINVPPFHHSNLLKRIWNERKSTLVLIKDKRFHGAPWTSESNTHTLNCVLFSIFDLEPCSFFVRHLSHHRARNQGWGRRVGEAPSAKFFAPQEKCFGHSLKLFDIFQKFWAPLRKHFAPPGVSSWLRACSSLLLLCFACFTYASMDTAYFVKFSSVCKGETQGCQFSGFSARSSGFWSCLAAK